MEKTETDKKRVILLINPNKPQTSRIASGLLEWLTHRVHVVADNLNSTLDLTSLPPADFIIVLGGDGTILSTARTLGPNQIPIIGVNMGKLGFLAEFSIEQLREQFDFILSHGRPYSRRIMLNCRVFGPGRPDFVSTIVNELAVTAGPPFRMIEVSISIGGEHLARCAGDGLIVATPTGSTAYNLSAGGPIMASSLRAAVITPLAAHSLSFRPIVADLDKPIVLRCKDARRSGIAVGDENRNVVAGAVVVIDGQEHTHLGGNDQVIITPAQHQFLLVQNPKQSQWHLLNTKLNWGVPPNYG